MKIQIKIAFLALVLIAGQLLSSNSIIYSQTQICFRGGGLRGGDRDFGFDNNFADRSDDRERLNNPDVDEHPAETQNFNWNGEHPAGSFARSALDNSHITNPVSTPEMTDRGNAVRQNYAYDGLYNRNFWTAHPEADWAYAHRWDNNWAWGYTGWPALATWWGMPLAAMPAYYDYGNNINYQNGSVYYGSQPVESTLAYYSQAQTLASSVPITAAETSSKSNWKPLGVFSMVQGNQTNTTTMFQLAVNKKGALKGSYYNPLTGETKPVTGAINKKNMRASWIIGKDKNVVYDTGLNNLLQAQSQMLVHYGKDKTQQWTLVRLAQPKAT